ncbi:hypothetical protein BC829DRAFT_69110 [Chytridium lagenaria]|nr:hypothetical protein BC829DRAFT_69110 [Chytridium lagenaria]
MLLARKTIKDWTSSFTSTSSASSSSASSTSSASAPSASHHPSSSLSSSPLPSRSPSPSLFSSASKNSTSPNRRNNGKSRPKSMMRRLTLMKHGSASSSSSLLTFSKDSFERVLTEWDLFNEFKNYALVRRLYLLFSFVLPLVSSNVHLINDYYVRPSTFALKTFDFGNPLSSSKTFSQIMTPPTRHGLDDTTTGTWALSRFLNKPIHTLLPTIDPVPADIIPHFLYFHATFLAKEAPLEVNIPGSVRNRIQAEMGRRKSGGGGGSFSSNLFDKAIDEVISLLYFNTFKGFVAYREKNGPSKTMQMMSAQRLLLKRCVSVGQVQGTGKRS